MSSTLLFESENAFYTEIHRANIEQKASKILNQPIELDSIRRFEQLIRCLNMAIEQKIIDRNEIVEAVKFIKSLKEKEQQEQLALFMFPLSKKGLEYLEYLEKYYSKKLEKT